MDADYWKDGYLIRRKLVPGEMIDTHNQYAHNPATSS